LKWIRHSINRNQAIWFWHELCAFNFYHLHFGGRSMVDGFFVVFVHEKSTVIVRTLTKNPTKTNQDPTSRGSLFFNRSL
jgi:hypothetical protein